jgi:hypothetical protein
LLVALHDREVLEEDRRARRFLFVVGGVVGFGVDAFQVALPLQVAVDVVGVEPPWDLKNATTWRPSVAGEAFA